MNIGVTLSALHAAAATGNVVDRAIELGSQAERLGLDSVWFPQLGGYDAIAMASAVGRAVTRIRVGPAVVPIFPRHPQLLASAAKTAQAATGGRFHLGIGLGAKHVLEPAYGLPYPPPITHLREYLSALRPLLAGTDTGFNGATVTSQPFGPTAVPGAEQAIAVVVAAMGPQALRVAGELADGTVTFLAGPRALEQHIVPALTQAAADAGRPSPRIIVTVPAVVTGKVEQVMASATEQLAFYETIPSHQRVLAWEGVDRAAELVVAGDEDTVAAGLRRYLDAGATEITLYHTELAGETDRERTWSLAGELAG
ncbi:TIGR03564 family F420-dependent LLM class oxidoreductase [Streptomyces hyaluromycini]|uniref:TIGR03564 family F420-dependent LLM class oxidoreductase n=1 Tax=Streptomyces hyaluromycini TaxID=1377993 RepID=UPI000B5CD061|nr:TIGR03564 family F420-dependent LLM class oxidoreductase [Streptomyces hyaluromycini]